MKSRRLFLVSVAAITVTLISAVNLKSSSTEIPYPEGYREWTHVKSGMVGPKHPLFNKLGGFYHIYANSKAMEGYRTGRFVDGSVIAFDRLEMIESENGDIIEGQRRLVDVMAKDHIRYDSTGGWGFEEFKGNSTIDRNVLHLSRKMCFNCHSKREKNDFIFSQFRK